ncbi:MAG TPA: hypothetical protein PKI49_05355 [Pseudomonadota bacterium]|jgi:hypothetical protein|nr:hypothetical protein [Pseudomonadota bacterium]HNF97536.1 hypothetical protein [Pseudomonadota bacterium]HNI58387.1 hypothetical protein [Pseudomonadota bacterium]HNK47270.1 hypothetical protein [Pseudomonadota bacterium]HNN49480.1 hypothetical protein [Pseudomonadota bacterium]
MSAEQTPPDSPKPPSPKESAASTPSSASQVPSKDTPSPRAKPRISSLLDVIRGERPSGSSPLPSQLSPRPSGLTPSPSQLSPRPSQLSPKLAPKRHISQVIETLKLPNRDIAERLVRLGFDSETACVLHVLPLIQVAWANNDISRRERSRILHVLKLREIPEGSRAWVMVESMLETRPTDAFLHACREVLRDMLATSKSGPGQEERQLIDLCVEIAEASGGLFGLVRAVSAAEKTVIADIAATFGDDAQQEMKRLLS